MKKLTLLLVIGLIQVIGFSKVFAQTQVSIPIKDVKGFVLEFNEPFNQILIDVDPEDNNFTKEETITVVIKPETKLLSKSKKSIAPNLIRRGTLVEIRGDRLGSAVTATEVKLQIDIEKWEVGFKGYFEALEGDKAWINGKSVKISDGVIIQGTDEWKKKTFSSFNEMMLGSEVEVKGILKSDGIIYATKIETRPNLFSKTEKDLAKTIQRGLLIPNGLSGGFGSVLGRRIKFVENLELQTYVTKVGYKVIPRYQKDLAKDDPAKITFRFMVIEDPSFNAFALPDGSVFVHTGLLQQIKNEAQLAAVLGHEVAHVTHEHARKRIDCFSCDLVNIGAQVGGQILGGNLGQAIGQMGAQAFQNMLGRSAEDQADRVGLLYMYQAGYDPREAANVWRAIARETKENVVTNFLYSDHSMARQRVKNLNRELAYSFYDTDFSQAKKGDDDYTKIVGSYFGWASKTQSNPVFQSTMASSSPPTALANSPTPAPSPATAPVTAFVDNGFNAFFDRFKKAVLAGNRIAIKGMMSGTFQWAKDGPATREEAIQNMDSMSLWTALKEAMLSNPTLCKPTECNNRAGYRVASATKNRIQIMFERDAGGEWKWSAILGD